MVLLASKSPINLLSNLVSGFGVVLVIFSLFIFERLFHDPLGQEIKYAITSSKQDSSLRPANTQFSIVIPKIGASSAIIKDIDPYNSALYQLALKDGVAHARDTNFPGEGGNIFLFAHSSADLLTAERYNSIFYLIHHLELGDKIKIWKDDKEYNYLVSEKIVTDASNTSYLTAKSNKEQLTLMTCWPPGTSLKRLIVIADTIDIE